MHTCTYMHNFFKISQENKWYRHPGKSKMVPLKMTGTEKSWGNINKWMLKTIAKCACHRGHSHLVLSLPVFGFWMTCGNLGRNFLFRTNPCELNCGGQVQTQSLPEPVLKFCSVLCAVLFIHQRLLNPQNSDVCGLPLSSILSRPDHGAWDSKSSLSDTWFPPHVAEPLQRSCRFNSNTYGSFLEDLKVLWQMEATECQCTRQTTITCHGWHHKSLTIYCYSVGQAECTGPTNISKV